MSQNGWAENATISGSKSSNIATSRSTHDSYPTCLPVVTDHHSPGKFRWPLKVGNDLDGLARSNGASQHDGRGSRRWAPVSSMNDTTNEEPAVARIGTGEPLIVPHPREIHRCGHAGFLNHWPEREASNDPSLHIKFAKQARSDMPRAAGWGSGGRRASELDQIRCDNARRRMARKREVGSRRRRPSRVLWARGAQKPGANRGAGDRKRRVVQLPVFHVARDQGSPDSRDVE